MTAIICIVQGKIKDVPVSGSGEEHEAGSGGGGEDPSSLQLTPFLIMCPAFCTL